MNCENAAETKNCKNKIKISMFIFVAFVELYGLWTLRAFFRKWNKIIEQYLPILYWNYVIKFVHQRALAGYKLPSCLIPRKK